MLVHVVRPFLWQRLFFCISRPQRLYPFSRWWPFGLFPVLGIINKALVNILCKSFGGHMRFFSFLEVELLCHMIGICLTLLDTHQQAMRVLVVPHPPPIHYIVRLFISGHACGSNIFKFFKVQFCRVPRKVLPPLLMASILSLPPAFFLYDCHLHSVFCLMI